MKKIIQVLVIGVFLFTSLLQPIEKAHANPYAIPVIKMAAGAAAGPYVIAGVLIAGGAAAVVGMSDPEIQQYASDIWDRTSDGFKNSVADAVAASSGAIEWTADMGSEVASAIGSMANTASDTITGWLGIREAEQDGKAQSEKYNATNYSNNFTLSAKEGYYFPGGSSGFKAHSLSMTAAANLAYEGVKYKFTYSGWNNDRTAIIRNPSHERTWGLSMINAFNDIYFDGVTVDKMKKFFRAAGASVGVASLTSSAPAPDVINNNIDKALTGLQGVKEINIPLDNWLGKATTKTGQKVNVDTATGAITYPDGRVYEGDITIPWDIPKGGASDIPAGTIGFPEGAVGYPEVGVANPSIPIDKVFPKPAEVPVETPVAPGLWGWLEGLLKAILDAIKALAGLIAAAIGALFIPEKPIGEMFAPFISLIGEKFNTPSDFDFLKNAFSNGSKSCPDDIGITISGKNLDIVDLGFACDAAKWWKPIMSGFIWFLFGFWLFRKSNQLMSKRGGVE